MFTHYGCITTRFFPAKSHGALTAADLAGTTLEPLSPFVDKLLMPRGIRAMNEWTVDMARGQGNDSHTQVVGSYFTCHPVAPNSDQPFAFETETKFNAKPIGPSLDHVIARQLSPSREPLLMLLAQTRAIPQSAISYSAPETLYPGFPSAAAIFAHLTGVHMGSDAPATPDAYQAARGRSILDLVREDLESLQRNDMSRADREKLEAWKALIHDTQGVVAQCSRERAEALEVTEANLSASAAQRATDEDALTRRITATMDNADLYSNLAVLAALCNSNPVIVLKYPANHTFVGLGLTTESSGVARRLDSLTQGICASGAIDKIHTIDRYYARKFAYLVDQLNRIDEGDGKLLDNTAAVWFQDVSDGAARNLNNLPIVQAGSAGGYFKTGWAVNVDDGSPDLTRGNSEIVCGPGGPNEIPATGQITGTDPALASAPINKYFCNLMNALGVKAGKGGFPDPAGDAEVTHFGMYDRTEDFIGGGTNPPIIHDPGEFAELRANA